MTQTVDLRTGSDDLDKLGHAKAASIKSDIWLRAFMVLVVSGIFVWLNYQIVELVTQAIKQDQAMISARTLLADDRLITSNVIVSLVGATVVQTGIGFIAVTSYLFPKRANEQG